MLKNISHNLKIFLNLCSMNIKMALIYRKSFYVSLIAIVFWITIYTALIEVIYVHTDEIAGWAKGEILIILSFYYLITGIANFLFRENFEEFGEKMRRGFLDQFLTKPAMFQVQCFFSRMRFDQISSPVIVIFLFWYGASQLTEPLILQNIVIGCLYAILSVAFFYHFLLLVATSTFYLEKADTLGSVMWNLSQVGRYPRQIFTGFGKIFFQFIFPMALITSIPAEIFVGFEALQMHIFFFAIVLGFCILAQLVFNIGLKKYSSAS